MAQSAAVEDDSFLDEVDDSFLDEVPSPSPALVASKPAAPEKNWAERLLPGGEQVYNARAMAGMTPEERKQFIADAYNGKNKDNAAFLLGLIRGGTLEGAPLVSRLASPAEYRDEATAVYDEHEQESPMATLAGRVIGAAPAAAVLAQGAPTLGGALQSGLGAGALATIQGFLGSKVGAGARSDAGEFSGDNVAGKAMDAWSQVPIAVAAQLGGMAAPEIVSRVKNLPRQGIDALADWLGQGKAAAPAAVEAAPVVSRADDFAAQMADAAPDDVAPLKPVYDKVQAKPAFDPNTDTGAMKMIDPELDAVGKGDMPGSKFKSKDEAWRKIVNASGVDDFNQSRQAGHFDEVERVVGRKVRDTKDAFDALVAASAKKRGKARGTHDWEDVQTAIRTLKEIEGLERLQLPSDVQEAILPIEKEPSFNFGWNAERPPAKDPDFIQKSGELADMLAEDADTVVDASIYPGPRGPDIKHKGAYRGQGYKFPDPTKRVSSEGMDLSLDPEAMAEFQARTKPTSTLDDLLFGEPSVDEARAWEQLKAGELGASQMRNPAGVDSRVARQPAPANGSAASFDGPPTNAKGGADLYQPMGVGEVFPDTQVQPMGEFYQRHGANRMTDDLFAEIEQQVNAQGADARARMPRLMPQEAIDVPEFNAARDAAKAQQAAQAMTPWDDDAIDGARKAGYEKLQSIVGAAGKRVGQGIGGAIGGTLGGVGGLPGQIGGGFLGSEIGKDVGAKLGAKVGEKLFSPEKAAQRLAKDPAMLQRLAAQGGELGRAAAFIAHGAQEGGETGMKARAYIAAMLPSFRALFEQQEQR